MPAGRAKGGGVQVQGLATEVMDMFRKFAIAAVVLCLSATSRVFAIGLGDIQIQSSLNDPLKAVIELTSGTRQELDELKVTIAPRDAFTRMGISRAAILDDVKFSVEQPQNGLPVILVTTRQPVREPFLDLLIEASWSKGRLLRQYTLLVDPPVTMPAEPPAQRAPVRQSAAPVPEAGPAPVPVREPLAAPVATPSARAAASVEADKYGPVKRNETLWDIAKRLRPGGDVSMHQMMLALLRANPEAFAGNNINNLKAGATLQIPTREEILALDRSAARREVNRQYAEWQQGRTAEQTAATAHEPETPAEQTQSPQAAEAPPAVAETSAPADATQSRLQLVAPDEESIKGAAAPGTAEGDTVTAPQQPAGSPEVLQQLALATEEAEAGRAQTQELQSRVGKLEQQVVDMQRLIELKDEQLANLQNRLAAQNQAAATSASEAAPAADATPQSDRAASQPPAPSREAPAANRGKDGKPPSMIDRLLENPVLAGLGVLVAMVLGGFLWSSTRHRKQDDIFSEEPTLASQLAASRYEESPENPHVDVRDAPMLDESATGEISPLHGDDASDPLTEADVFIAYGRVQQAEEVIANALQHNPDSRDLKMKLLEIYHAAGNVAAFDAQAAAFRESVGDEDADWPRVAGMGYELSPANPLYQTGMAESTVRDGEVDFHMDLAGTDENAASVDVPDAATELDYESLAAAGEGTPDAVSFNLDDLNLDAEDEDLSEGLLQESDEIGTKLDLARAYMDMGDPDGARGILEEVIEDGNDEQKNEAETLISQLA
jgi:pilus assembly protein FimV